MKWYSFNTVSDGELKSLLSKDRFKNLFDFISYLENRLGSANFPNNWLITSIDKYITGVVRTSDSPMTNHQNQRAVDITPLSSDLRMRFPVPLNRNLLLQDAFVTAAQQYGITKLPIIVFEAEHIHTDINQGHGIFRLKESRRYFDKGIFFLSRSHENDFLNRVVNSKDVVRLL